MALDPGPSSKGAGGLRSRRFGLPREGEVLDVLVVDDLEEDRLLVRRLLHGLEEPRVGSVREVSSIEAGLAEVRDRVPDVIILDNRLTDGTAADFLEQLATTDSTRQAYSGSLACAIIVLTGDSDPKLAADVIRRGAGDYLPKSELVAASREAARQARRVLADSVRRAREHHHLTRRAARLLAGSIRKRSMTQLAKRAETQARLAADLALKRLQHALDAGQMGTWDLDIATSQLSLDARQRHLFDIDVETPSLDEAMSRIVEDDLPAVEEAVRACVEGEQRLLEIEFRIRRRDGVVRWLSGKGRVIDDGSRRHMLGVNIDVTAEREAVEALRHSEAQNLRQFAELSAIYETAPVGLGLLDADLRFTSVNLQLAHILGLSADALVGRPASEVLPAGVWGQVRVACETAYEKQDRQRVQVRREDEPTSHDGVQNTLWAFGGIRRPDGRPGGVNLVVQDVTDLRRQEERLAAQASLLDAQRAELSRRNSQLEIVNRRLEDTSGRLEALLAGAPVGFAFFDRKGMCLQVNPELARISGVPESGHAGRTIDDIFGTLGRTLQPYITRVDETRHPVIGMEIEGVTRASHPTSRWFLISFFPIHAHTTDDAAAEAVGCVMLDITDRKRGERLLREAKENAISARISADRARELAERASRAKSEFLAVLSHELRTPLTPVLAGAQMLERALHAAGDVAGDVADAEGDGAMHDRDDLRDLARESLTTIRRNVELEVRLIDDLLDLTRITRGKLQLSRRPMDLNEAVRHAVETCHVDGEDKGVQIELRLADGPLGTVADSARVQQVVWNLVKNAIKFTPAAGHVVIATGHQDTPTGPLVTCTVFDDGLGIDPEHLPSIFNAFEQGGRGTTRTFGGLGLGLAISRYLVDAHGGQLSAHSRGAGTGATFRLALPARQIRRVETAKPPAVAAPTEPVGRVLLVEDHDDTSRLMARYLKMRLGADVTRAATVADGRQRFGEAEAAGKPFDLIISDIGLPDGSGVDFLGSLPPKRPPAVALSGYGTEADIRRSRDAGFAEHLVKPVDLERLEQTVRRTLGVE